MPVTTVQIARPLLPEKNQHSSPALSAASEAEHVSYVCPMHPEIVADQPGDCPICGMPLVAHTHAHTPQNSAFPAVKISPTVAHNLGVRLAQAHTGTMQRKIETIGKITRIDPTARQILTPPISGELSFVADKDAGDQVKKGNYCLPSRHQNCSRCNKNSNSPLRTATGNPPRKCCLGYSNTA
nr:heavy metal-binding domain-containing protein [Methylomarinum sp. Ch1-1]MDP4522950.1 heavy metal-binding domain-containing protein [Methylomarinum sp. Ch1-1]